MTYESVLAKLYELENAEKVRFKEKKFGIVSKNSLGIYHKDLKIIAKEIGANNALALQLFNSGIYEARILCSKIFNPKNVTEDLMEHWVKTFENWEICDSFCMGIFAKSEFALAKIIEWKDRTSTFEKRASFATMAAYCMADKKSDNALFVQFLPFIKEAATDERVYVKKAVNWALRNIGKRNVDLQQKAIETANEMLLFNNNTATWIAKNALSELTKLPLRMSDYPRNRYRN